MEIHKLHQARIIWKDMASPVSIPRETQDRLAGLLGDLIAEYWVNCKEINCPEKEEDQNGR